MKNISPIQEPILLTQNIFSKSIIYNVGGYALIEGKLDTVILLKSIEQVLLNIDIIKVGFCAFNEDKEDKFDAFQKIDYSVLDFSKESNADDLCTSWINSDINHAFDLKENFLKIRVLKSFENKFYWYVKVHHLIFDGYSMSLFFNKVSYLYTEMMKENIPSFEVFKYQDFIDEYVTYKSSEDFVKDSEFWLERLKPLMGSRLFQSCLNSEKRKSFASKRKEIRLSRELVNCINGFSTQYNCTIFHYFTAVIFILNHLYDNSGAVLGLPLLNRRNKKYKNTFGAFVNMLPFSVNLEESWKFIEILKHVKDKLKGCYRHERFPLYSALEKLDSAGNIYNASFSYQKSSYQAKLGEAAATIKYIHSGEQQEDLAFHLLEFSKTGDVTLSLDYKEESISNFVADNLLNHFNNLLVSLYQAPDMRLSDLEYLSGAERNQLLNEFNATEVGYARDQTIVDLFEAQVALTPEAVALVFEEHELTYGELNRRSNQLGAYLRTTGGIRPDELVGVKLHRSELLVIALLGILKSGGACVPIDPEYPQERISYMEKDSGIRVLLDEHELSRLEPLLSDYSEDNLVKVNGSSDLAYVIYTSGSTGTPKGVMIEHGGIVNQLYSKINLLSMAPSEGLCHNSQLHFVGGLWQLWSPLISGGFVVLCAQAELQDMSLVLEKVSFYHSRILEVIPSQLNSYLSGHGDKIDLTGLEFLILTGEKLSSRFVQCCYDGNPGLRLMNAYGQTELSNDTMSYVLSGSEDHLLIGRPIQNTYQYILGKDNGLCAVGVVGELCTSGAGLSRGYLNLPELTAEKFVANPYRLGELMYRTGDLGRWLCDGNIELIGRKDEQLKIRGYRIEPGEIERVLLDYSGVEGVVVTGRKLGDEMEELVAYLVCVDLLNTSDLRTYLSSRLPSYMLPG
ncbi:amino acid adenylation domain-containing protein, partial [Pedobacter psychrotolerans]